MRIRIFYFGVERQEIKGDFLLLPYDFVSGKRVRGESVRKM